MKKVILIVGLVLIVFGGGYITYIKLVKKTNIGLPGTTSSLNATCEFNDANLCKFLNSWKEQKYYTVNSTTTQQSEQKTSNVYKTVGDDKNQMIAMEEDKEVYNTIVIGETTYTKDYSDNKWWKQTATPSTNSEIAAEESRFDFDESADTQKITYKKVGTETCGSLTCFKYQVIDPANTESTDYIYFDDKEYLLRKMRNEAKDGSITESTFDYSKISIESPSPIKEGNPFDIPQVTP